MGLSFRVVRGLSWFKLSLDIPKESISLSASVENVTSSSDHRFILEANLGHPIASFHRFRSAGAVSVVVVAQSLSEQLSSHLRRSVPLSSR